MVGVCYFGVKRGTVDDLRGEGAGLLLAVVRIFWWNWPCRLALGSTLSSTNLVNTAMPIDVGRRVHILVVHQ